MGEIIDNLNKASNGTPYTGQSVDSSMTGSNQENIGMGKPQVLLHSYEDQKGLYGDPIFLNENKNHT